MTKCKVNMLIIFPSTKKLRFSRGQVFAAAGLWFGERNNVEGPTQVAANCGDGFYIWTKLTAYSHRIVGYATQSQK